LISLGILSLKLVSSEKGTGIFVGKNIAYLIITSENDAVSTWKNLQAVAFPSPSLSQI